VSMYAAQLRSHVVRLLKDLGETATLRRITTGTYQPGSGATGGDGSPIDQSIRVVFTKRRDSFSALLEALASEGTVSRSTRVALIAAVDPDGNALGFAPQTNDQIVGIGDTVAITRIRRLNAATSDVAWIAEVKDA